MAQAEQGARVLTLGSPRRRATTAPPRRTREAPVHRLQPPEDDRRLDDWWRLWQLARSVALFLVGAIGLVYEALRDGAQERPLQLGAYLGCLGLNMVTAGRGSGEQE